MSWFGRFFGSGEQKAPNFVLEIEGRQPLHDPSVAQVKEVILGLVRSGPSFACLTDHKGNYLQVAGSRPWCLVERRIAKPKGHARAYQETPNPKYNDGAKLSTGAGEIVMQHDEWFLLKDAAEIMEAFQLGTEFPSKVQWRSMNEMFGI